MRILILLWLHFLMLRHVGNV